MCKRVGGLDVGLSTCGLVYQQGCALTILGVRLELCISMSQSPYAKALVSEHARQLHGALTSNKMGDDA